jgi:hypothetical protein
MSIFGSDVCGCRSSMILVVMRMTCRKRLGLLAGLCLGAVALVVSLFIHFEQPACGNHPISYWFKELPPTSVWAGSVTCAGMVEARGRKYGIQSERPDASLAAIRAIGAKGLPFLLRKLNQQQTPVMRWTEWCASKCGIKRSIFPDPEFERMQAVTALLALGSLPPEATRELRSLSSRGTNSIARSAGFVLGANTNAQLKVISVSRISMSNNVAFAGGVVSITNIPGTNSQAFFRAR